MTADLSYLQVTTLTNDFGIVAATAPFLFGVQDGYVGTIIAGPAFTAATAWTITASDGDGLTSVVTVLRTTAADGPFIAREVLT